jgi:hypothetical protein
MNQSLLIGFALFLLIIILLMLLFSDAKEKSGRIRVYVYISGNPKDPQISSNVSSLLDNLATENNFDFSVAEAPLPADFHSSANHAVILYLQPHLFTSDQYESSGALAVNRTAVWIDPAEPHVIWAAAGADASRCTDAEFASMVRNAILKVASLKKVSEGKNAH